MELNSVLAKALKKINPKQTELQEALELFGKVQKFISEKFNLQAELMGSVAKDTFIRGDKDLDIFVFFPENTERKVLEKKGLEIGKAVFRKFNSKNFEISYAEHPYTRGFIHGFEIEVVPAYAIQTTDTLKSAVDRTPFHTRYVQKHLGAEKTSHVRLLKAFLKSIGSYGSDLKTSGFSGYLSELLIVKYGTFENVLQEAMKWQFQQIIDIENHHLPQNAKHLKKVFAEQPLIFIDPTDKSRNVAAVLSKGKLSRLIFFARKFLQKPEEKYFVAKSFAITKGKINKTVSEIKAKKANILVVAFKKPEVIDDILYPQLRKFKMHVMHELNRHDFKVERAFEFADDAQKIAGIGLELLNDEVPKIKIIFGPSIFNPKQHQDNFIAKHKRFWFEDDRFRAEIERKDVSAESFIKSTLKKKEKQLKAEGIPGYVASSISRKFYIFGINSLQKIKAPDFWESLKPSV